jgi:hypothetical protein
MSRLSHMRGAVVTTTLLLLLALSAAAGTGPPGKVIHLPGTVKTRLSIAMDGPRFAYNRSARAEGAVDCNSVFVFNLLSGANKRISSPCLSSSSGHLDLAVGGQRVAWIDSDCGNTECWQYLWVASLPRLKARLLARASMTGEVGGSKPLVGDSFGGLVGSGKLLAVNVRTQDAKGATVASELDVIAGKRLRRVVSGPRGISAQAADAGRIAVLRKNATVGIYSAAGKFLLKVKPSSVARDEGFDGNAIALQGDYLLVLTATRRLEVYNSHSGALLHRWLVRKNATNLRAHAGVAAYAELPTGPGGLYKVHIVRLATGKDVVLGKANEFLPRSMEMGSAGLVYVKNQYARLGKEITLVFVPLRHVLAAVS